MGTQKYSVSYITFLSLLAALGSIMMLFEIPYPFIGFLTFELSEIVILLVVVIFGLKPAILVAAIKAFLHLLIKGPVGPMGIGQITAFVASVTIAGAFYFFNKKFNNKEKEYKVFSYVLSYIYTGLTFTAVMVIANYLFITPIWFGGLTFLDVQSWVTPEAFGLGVNSGGIDPYLFTIIITYLPFNLIKISMVLTVFASINEILRGAFKTYYRD